VITKPYEYFILVPLEVGIDENSSAKFVRVPYGTYKMLDIRARIQYQHFVKNKNILILKTKIQEFQRQVICKKD